MATKAHTKVNSSRSTKSMVPSQVEAGLEYHIGIRELRQDASRVIELVIAGANITVTKHGKPVATINPTKQSKMDILLEKGAITPARHKINLRNWKPLTQPDSDELINIVRREREASRF